MANWPASFLTVEAFEAMTQDDDWKEEVIDGILYRSPPHTALHGITSCTLGCELSTYCKSKEFGRVSSGSGLVVARRPDSVLGPDVQVFSNQRPPNNPKGWPTVPPTLVAEVVDGPTDYHLIMAKVPLYLAFGVDLVWVIRPQVGDVQIYCLSDQQVPVDRWQWIEHDARIFTTVRDGDILTGGDVLPEFTCLVADLFGW